MCCNCPCYPASAKCHECLSPLIPVSQWEVPCESLLAVLPGYMESAIMAFASTFIFGDHLNCPLPLQQVLPDKQMNLPPISLVAFQSAVFSLGPKASKTLYEPSKREISASDSTLGSLMSAPLFFQARHTGVSYLQRRSQSEDA